MDNKQIADKLTSLMQLDYDASQAYDQAIGKIDTSDSEIKENLAIFRDDHLRHVSDLGSLIRSLGEEPPEISRDVKGFVIEGMTSLMSAMGTQSALKSMQQNEKLTNKTYRDAVSSPDFTSYPPDCQVLIQKNYNDEQHHLAYIDSALKVEASAR